MLYLYRETYIERNPGESANDRNDRAIRVAAKWYNMHLSSLGCEIKTVLLTDDVRNRELAIEEGIPVLSSKIFFVNYIKVLFSLQLILVLFHSGGLCYFIGKFGISGR